MFLKFSHNMSCYLIHSSLHIRPSSLAVPGRSRFLCLAYIWALSHHFPHTSGHQRGSLGHESGTYPLNQILLTRLPEHGHSSQRGEVTGQGLPKRKQEFLMLFLCLLSLGTISSPQMAFFLWVKSSSRPAHQLRALRAFAACLTPLHESLVPRDSISAPVTCAMQCCPCREDYWVRQRRKWHFFPERQSRNAMVYFQTSHK